MLRVLFLTLLVLACPGVFASADTLRVDLDAVEVRATRVSETAATAPLSVAVEARDPMELALDAGTSLEAALRHLPGLWVSDRQNFALGERISIRGMGARAGFGVRGVQVVMDGIPLTMPDGQSAIAIADPGIIRRAELVRGPASTIWGNASGGVLLLNTLPEEDRRADINLQGGTFGLLRTEGEIALPVGRHRGGLALSHVRREGFRDHSAFAVTRGRGFASFDLAGNVRLLALGAFEWAPEQEHPGALTAEQLAEDPRQAQQNFVAQAAGKDSRQGQLGVALDASTAIGRVTASAFGIIRDLENPLPFAIIDVYRLAGGTRTALEREDGPVRWTVGFDTGIQRDDRQNHANQQGERGALRLDQLETVTTLGAFSRAALTAGQLTGSIGIRHDRTTFTAADRLETNDGDRTLAAWSPSAGISYRVGPALVFASVSTAFETPTTTELVNRPDGATGFNPDIEPQRTVGLEAGVRGTDHAGRIYYDAALFRLDVTDQLVPFEGADGRNYFRNVEGTVHEGIELLVEWNALPWLRLGGTYGWSRFAFTEASGELAGNRLPGVPEHRGTLKARATTGPVFTRLSLLAAGPTWADDLNTARADGFAVVDLAFGHSGLMVSGGRWMPFIQIQNLFDVRYAGSVALNAQGGRFFEPGQGRSIQIGLQTRLL